MGLMRYHVIIVSTEIFYDQFEICLGHARRIFGDAAISNVLVAPINGVNTFMVGPDGYKEYCSESKEGDSRRTEFVECLKADGPYLKWVEVEYGDQTGHLEHQDKVIRGNGMYGLDEEGDTSSDVLDPEWCQWPLRGWKED